MSESIPSCRKNLSSLPETGFSHPGLALTRYLKLQNDTNVASNNLLKGMTESGAGKVYEAAFARWKECQEADATVVTFSGTLATPMAIGLGNKSALEIGLTLHHTYGMPVIPGTALKGLCHRGADLLNICEPQHKALFGDTASAGYFTFWDAWFDPNSVGDKPFKQDVITVHHPKYYQERGKDNHWPTDFEDPIPIPFLVVRPGVKFFFALTVPSQEWGVFASGLLRWSLENLGVGAKTNAGYGYFKKEKPVDLVNQTTPRDIWENVIISWNAGKTTLNASDQSKKAFATGKEAKNLLDTLPENAKEQLKTKKKTLFGDVSVEPSGSNWIIKSIKTLEEKS